MKLFIIGIVFLGFGASVLSQEDCKTPNDEDALCIPIYNCTHFLSAIQEILNQPPEFSKFLRESSCGLVENKTQLVCCGSVVNYQKFNLPVQQNPFFVQQNAPPQNPWFQFIQESPSLQGIRGTNQLADPRVHRNFNLLPGREDCGAQGLGNKIVGGMETDIDEFPWMALLEYRKGADNSGHQCGGMLISDNYVLTAAHCVTGQIVPIYGTLQRVRLGEYDRRTGVDCIISAEGSQECNEAPQDIDVEEYIVHASYEPDSKHQHHDIALVRLRNRIKISDFVKPVCLPTNFERSSPEQNLTVSGWGRTEKTRTSAIKLKANVPYIEDSRCKSIYQSSSLIQITDDQFCAGGTAGIDSCTGDSGGPIMSTFSRTTTWYVEGIVSFGPKNCGTRGVPGVYTRVFRYINWILDNMRP